MAERVTKAEVEAVFKRMCGEFGIKIAAKHGDPNGAFLDYNPTYGGYKIGKYMSKGSGEDEITRTRMSPREFVDACHFAMNVKRGKA